jgi:flagellar biosynthesis protein FlhG
MRSTHVLSVTSGKGGVGKSNLVVNVAIALAQRRKRVLVLDADMGLANVDILIGMTSRHNLSHVLSDAKRLEEVICEGPGGIHVLPASSGVEWMANLTVDQKVTFLQKMDALNGLYDILLIDTGAGISSNVVYFNLAAQTRIVMVTPEPTSLTDAYALIKVLHLTYHLKTFEVVVNSVANEKEGLEVYRNLTTVADRFLDVRLGYLGHIERSDQVRSAVLRQTRGGSFPRQRRRPGVSRSGPAHHATAHRFDGQRTGAFLESGAGQTGRVRCNRKRAQKSRGGSPVR